MKLSTKRRQSELIDLDDGKRYVMRELLGEDRAAYNMAKTEGVERPSDDVIENPSKASSDHKLIRSMLLGKIKTDTLLVSLCLYELKEDGTEERVSEDVVKSWPSRVIDALASEAERLNAQDEGLAKK